MTFQRSTSWPRLAGLLRDPALRAKLISDEWADFDIEQIRDQMYRMVLWEVLAQNPQPSTLNPQPTFHGMIVAIDQLNGHFDLHLLLRGLHARLALDAMRQAIGELFAAGAESVDGCIPACNVGARYLARALGATLSGRRLAGWHQAGVTCDLHHYTLTAADWAIAHPVPQLSTLNSQP